MAPSTGIEPVSPASEADTLSIKLRGQRFVSPTSTNRRRATGTRCEQLHPWLDGWQSKVFFDSRDTGLEFIGGIEGDVELVMHFTHFLP